MRISEEELRQWMRSCWFVDTVLATPSEDGYTLGEILHRSRDRITLELRLRMFVHFAPPWALRRFSISCVRRLLLRNHSKEKWSDNKAKAVKRWFRMLNEVVTFERNGDFERVRAALHKLYDQMADHPEMAGGHPEGNDIMDNWEDVTIHLLASSAPPVSVASVMVQSFANKNLLGDAQSVDEELEWALMEAAKICEEIERKGCDVGR